MMKTLKHLTLSTLSALGILLLTGSILGEVFAACPVINGTLDVSETVSNQGVIPEQDTLSSSNCQGFMAQIICFFNGLFANLSTNGGKGKLTLQDSQMPGSLRRANMLALHGDPTSEVPGAITGSIAKVLTPGYTQNNIDPLLGFTNSEGQMVSGLVVLNQNIHQEHFTKPVVESEGSTDPGWYELQKTGTPNGSMGAEFSDIAPLYDRYG